MSPPALSSRKADHRRIAAEAGIEHAGGTGLSDLRLRRLRVAVWAAAAASAAELGAGHLR